MVDGDIRRPLRAEQKSLRPRSHVHRRAVVDDGIQIAGQRAAQVYIARDVLAGLGERHDAQAVGALDCAAFGFAFAGEGLRSQRWSCQPPFGPSRPSRIFGDRVRSRFVTSSRSPGRRLIPFATTRSRRLGCPTM